MALVVVEDRVKVIIASILEVIFIAVPLVGPALGWEVGLIETGLAAIGALATFVFGVVAIHPRKEA
jgi:hypothetical protein